MSSTFDTFAPRQLTRDYFVGREQERECVRQLVRFLTGTHRGEQPILLQFYGVGGIGKIAFAPQFVGDPRVGRDGGGTEVSSSAPAPLVD